MEDYSELKKRYGALKDEIRARAVLNGRKESDVTLLAAVKYATADEINYLHGECGLCDVGENRVQTLLEHWEKLEDRENLRVHFIGSLQRNKVKYIIDKVCLIHSLDSFALAQEIDCQARRRGLVADVLIEINSAEEESKGGVLPSEAAALSEAVSGLNNVRLRGFMTMGPKNASDDEKRRIFTETYKLALDIWTEKLHNIGIPIMSMGMSDSMLPAIDAGAGIVRIGRALFGRTTPASD